MSTVDERGKIPFDAQFLRWMLSDGGGAVVVEDRPRPEGISLRIDWYHQRWAMCTDESLRAVLAHNRDEEVEHAVMTLEWVRRNMPVWDKQLRKRLFSEAPIVSPDHDD